MGEQLEGGFQLLKEEQVGRSAKDLGAGLDLRVLQERHRTFRVAVMANPKHKPSCAARELYALAVQGRFFDEPAAAASLNLNLGSRR